MIAEELMELGWSIARKLRDADPDFLEQTRRRKPFRGARFGAGAVAATPSSRDRRLTSLRQLAGIGKDDLGLPLVMLICSVTPICTLTDYQSFSGRVTAVGKIKVGLTDGGRAATC